MCGLSSQTGTGMSQAQGPPRLWGSPRGFGPGNKFISLNSFSKNWGREQQAHYPQNMQERNMEKQVSRSSWLRRPLARGEPHLTACGSHGCPDKEADTPGIHEDDFICRPRRGRRGEGKKQLPKRPLGVPEAAKATTLLQSLCKHLVFADVVVTD